MHSRSRRAAASHSAAGRVDSSIDEVAADDVLALLVLTALQPWLQKLGIGRLPGDLRFRRNGREIVLPFTSTVLLSLLLTALARIL